VTPRAAAALGDLLSGSPLPLRVAGGCMSPALQDGARPALERVTRVWPGDVVAFLTKDGALVAHRVLVALPGGRLYTQADREALPDAVVPRSRLVGRVDVPVSVVDRLRAVFRLGRMAWSVLRRRRA